MKTAQRYGMVTGLRPEAEAAYKTYHQAVWPEVLARITACNIRNYSIYLHQGTLFAYFEYTGDDYKADMQKMADDPKTQEWWSVMKPMQEPLASRPEGDWWTPIEEVFHVD
jgi:L-rhamnose mutarotase